TGDTTRLKPIRDNGETGIIHVPTRENGPSDDAGANSPRVAEGPQRARPGCKFGSTIAVFDALSTAS
ncbi:MAG: hypothetical protein NTZ61_09490, partial [Proteobacteria bacterium]|nr:hypothetical protein [Pseudomonadota bacterium]